MQFDDIEHHYEKLRKNFGKQPLFSVVRGHMLDSIHLNSRDAKYYCLRNPVHREIQECALQSEANTNTERVIFKLAKVNHLEGGWPKDVHYDDEEATLKYRKRIERHSDLADSILMLTPKMEKLVKQNNSVNIYENYFKRMEETSSIEKPQIILQNSYEDIDKRPVSSIDWTYEPNPKMVVSYCKKSYQNFVSPNTNFSCGYWDLENTTPISELLPPAACCQVVCSPVSPQIILGGLEDGRVCLFDVRVRPAPIQMSFSHLAHRAPVSALEYLKSRLANEFFSGSSDGKCMWYDIRNISEPIDVMIISLKPTVDMSDQSNAEGVSSLQFEKSFPTKFLCGTENGLVIYVNRKGKTHNDVMSRVYKAQNGPVKAIHRSPCSSKIFLTCGDWTVHVWTEDIPGSPIITGSPYRYQISDAAWAPRRVSAYMTVASDGILNYWDLLRSYKQPLITCNVSENPLLKVKPHFKGRMVAIGDKKGTVHLVSLTQSLVYSGNKDKQIMTEAFDREAHREHILEARIKEIRIRLKKQPKHREEVVDEELLVRRAEDSYKKKVTAEMRAYRIFGGTRDSKMRKR